MNILITGTSRGIGLELLKLALEKGHNIFAVGRKLESKPEILSLEKSYASKLSLISVDLANPEAPGQIASEVASNFESLDLLINNAGVMHKGEAEEDFLESFKINSVVPFLVTKALLPSLKKGTSPKVVQVTSLMGSIADNSSGGYYAYRASKSALNMINKSMAVDNPWLTTIVIHPGWVKTDMGGPQAPTSASESAQGIWKVQAELKPNDTAGYFDFRGKKLPW